MQTTLFIAQICTAVFLVVAILLQAQGTGFGTSWSGGGETFHTRRGLEKVMFNMTIVGIVVFILLSVGALVLPTA